MSVRVKVLVRMVGINGITVPGQEISIEEGIARVLSSSKPPKVELLEPLPPVEAANGR